MSIRLEEKPFELEGKAYILRCNMCVLDALQDLHGDDFDAFMNQPIREATAELLAAMLNDYAEDMDWPERWTARDVKKRFAYGYLRQEDIFGMLTRALIPESAAANENTEPGNDSGN